MHCGFSKNNQKSMRTKKKKIVPVIQTLLLYPAVRRESLLLLMKTRMWRIRLMLLCAKKHTNSGKRSGVVYPATALPHSQDFTKSASKSSSNAYDVPSIPTRLSCCSHRNIRASCPSSKILSTWTSRLWRGSGRPSVGYPFMMFVQLWTMFFDLKAAVILYLF